jgi:hypothetical protein
MEKDAFIDEVLESMELKLRKRPVTKAKSVAMVLGSIIPPDLNDDEQFADVDRIPGSLDYYLVGLFDNGGTCRNVL